MTMIPGQVQENGTGSIDVTTPPPVIQDDVADAIGDVKEEVKSGLITWQLATVVAVDAHARVVPDIEGSITVQMGSESAQTVTIPATSGVIPPVGTAIMLAMNGDEPMALMTTGQLVGTSSLESVDYSESALDGWKLGPGSRARINAVDGQILPFLSGADVLIFGNNFQLPNVFGTDLSLSVTAIITGRYFWFGGAEDWGFASSSCGISLGSGFTNGVQITGNVSNIPGWAQKSLPFACIHSRWGKPTGPILVRADGSTNKPASVTIDLLSVMWHVMPRNT